MSKKVEFDKELAEKLYKDGYGVVDIGKQCGVGYHTISKYLEERGIYKPKQRAQRSNSSTVKGKGSTPESLTSFLSQKSVATPDKSNKGTSNKRRRRKSTTDKPKTFTREEKIAYCNRKYGRDNWYFLSKDELRYELYFNSKGID